MGHLLTINAQGFAQISDVMNMFSVANNATRDLCADTFTGYILLWEAAGGGNNMGLFQCSGGASGNGLVSVLAGLSTLIFGNPNGLTTTVGVERSGGAYRVSNKTGGSKNFGVMLIGG